MIIKMVIYTLNDSNNPIVKTLKTNNQIVMLDLNNLEEAFLNQSASALLIDCNLSDCMSNKVKKIVNMFLDRNKEVILLNSNENIMVYLVGLGMDCKNAVIQPYMNEQVIINCLDMYSLNVTDAGGKDIVVDVNNNIKEERDIDNSNMFMSKQISFEEDTPVKTAIRINNLIMYPTSTELTPSQNFNIAADNAELPPGIVKTFYVKLERKSKVSPDESQEFNNQLVFVVELIASYKNPPYKYMQITTLGSGMNPTNGKGMIYNGRYSKGYWQDNITIKMYPLGDIWTQLETSPKNVNNVTNYEVTNTVKLDVDISKNPSFKPNYTLSNKYSSSILDFEITNKSIPELADWDFQLSMTKKSIEDIFQINIIDKPYVRDLPALATQNLQPYCSSLWYVDNTYNGKASVRCSTSVTYYKAWSEGFGLAYGAYWRYWKYGPQYNQFIVDFSEVNP